MAQRAGVGFPAGALAQHRGGQPLGLVAFQRLPINLLPDLSYPSLTVETRFPGAAPPRWSR